MAHFHPLCIALYHYLLLVLSVRILGKNALKTCLQLSKMSSNRVQFCDHDKVTSLIDSENEESDIDNDNESTDDNTTSRRFSSRSSKTDTECVKLPTYSPRGRHSSGDTPFKLQ